MVKRLSVAVVSALALAIWVSSAGAGQGGSEDFAGTWNVPLACGLGYGVTVSLTGTMRWNFDGNGEHVTVTGTATDTSGNSYVFNYRQNFKVVESGTLHITDHFNLVGSGTAPSLHTGFNLFIYADGSIKFTERGNPTDCDPI